MQRDAAIHTPPTQTHIHTLKYRHSQRYTVTQRHMQTHTPTHKHACLPSLCTHQRYVRTVTYTQKWRNSRMVTDTHPHTRTHPVPLAARRSLLLSKPSSVTCKLHPSQTGASESCICLQGPCVFAALPWPGVFTQKLETHSSSCVQLRKIPHFGVRLVCVL